MSKTWDKENMKTMGVNMKKDEAEAFKKLAEEQGTTVGAMLRTFIQASLNSAAVSAKDGKKPAGGVAHIVSYKNTDRLKHEVAFHNPRNLNPNEMLNAILDDYFAFVTRVRK